MKKLFVAITTIAAMLLPVLPGAVVSAEAPIRVILEDVTDASALKGETKVKISVDEVGANASIAQFSLNFNEDFDYKSIEYLYKNDNVTKIFPNAAYANAENKVNFGFVGLSPIIDLTNKTEICVLTFEGDPDEPLALSADTDMTYCMTGNPPDGEELHAAAVSITAAGAGGAANGVEAKVKITMDKVKNFVSAQSGGYSPAGIEVKITDEANPEKVYYTVVNNVSVSDGGHRTADSVPTFEIGAALPAGSYTVEIYGIGYTPVTIKGVTFEKETEITNSKLIPGDVNGDGNVDRGDAEALGELIDSGSGAESGDFNRDGNVDGKDSSILKASLPSSGGGGFGGGGGRPASTPKPSASPSPEATAAPETTAAPEKSPEPELTDKPFTDLGNHPWAEDAVYSLYYKGIISGTSETTYSPANNIKRGDFILILANMLGIDNSFDVNFADVPADSYYYGAIGSARAAGIAAGDGDNFMPENAITRQDLISLAYRAFVSSGYIEETADVSVLDRFADRAMIADYAADAMAAMVSAGIINGDGANINPTAGATRAEVAVMCANMVDIMGN